MDFTPGSMQSAQPAVYAIGDVNGRQLLAHAAEMQALRAVNHILGRADSIRLDVMPSAIFTSPEAACVGPSEDQLKAQGLAYRCRKAFWRANGKALAMNQAEGLLKLFTDADERLIGCHAPAAAGHRAHPPHALRGAHAGCLAGLGPRMVTRGGGL